MLLHLLLLTGRKQEWADLCETAIRFLTDLLEAAIREDNYSVRVEADAALMALS